MKKPQETRMMALFNGLTRAFGKYQEAQQPTTAGEKNKGRGITVHGVLTDANWKAHLSGQQRLGVVPIRDDHTVLFGAIDIDDYGLSVETIAQRASQFPLVITRSKSGGAHLWLFLKKPVQASIVRAHLHRWAVYLGYPSAEVFPKQDTLAGQDDVGNWINMPYFDADRTTCYGVVGGTALPLNEWLDLAESARVAETQLEQVAPPDVSGLEGSPPCLQAMALYGVPQGHRNVALFAFGVLAKKQCPSAWEDQLQKFNQTLLVPPLELREVNDTVKSHKKRDYFYPCGKPPLVSYCNKAICRKMEFGIGGSAEDPGVQIDSITKINTEPPSYIVQVNGKRVQFRDADTLLVQNKFRRVIFEVLDVVPTPVRATKWAELLNTLMRNATMVDAPEDAGIFGQFRLHLHNFCTGRARARDKVEMLQGKPYLDDEGWTWFRSLDLLTYLERQKFRAYSPSQIWVMLRERLGCKHKFFNLKGQGCNAWAVPPFSELGEQNEEFDVPHVEQVETFDNFVPAEYHEQSVSWEDD